MGNFTPSVFQKAIFDFISQGHGSAIVQAVAGSGKTTTMVEALKLIRGSALFCAFNKSIANELRKKAPRSVDVGTLHSVGFKIIRQNVDGRVEVYDKKIPDLIKTEIREDDGYYDRQLLSYIRRLVSLARGSLLGPDDCTRDTLADLIIRYGVDLNGTDLDKVALHVQNVMRRSLEDQNAIDFDDMIYLPAYFLREGRWKRRPQYDWLFVDEVQDLNRAQQEMVKHLLRTKGRMVCVGDRAQSVYGFRGADAESMNRMKETFEATEMPLSICYRCPRTHIELAKAVVPQIEAAENALEGVVGTVKVDDLATRVKEKDLILCRRNAPLVSLAFQLIAQGVKAVVRGRDIGKGLVSLIEKMKATDLPSLMAELEDYRAKEVVKLRAAEKETLAQAVEDKVECILAVSDGSDTIVQLKSKIERIFSDQSYGVVLSSIHRAKGLEADRVFLLERERMPMRWKGQKDWQLEQEMNLLYVALTRSTHELYFVESGEPGALYCGEGQNGVDLAHRVKDEDRTVVADAVPHESVLPPEQAQAIKDQLPGERSDVTVRVFPRSDDDDPMESEAARGTMDFLEAKDRAQQMMNGIEDPDTDAEDA